MLNELARYWQIMRKFFEATIVAFAIAAMAAVAGLAIIFGGKMLGLEWLYLPGQAVIVAGVCFAAWRVIRAEFVAIEAIQYFKSWRKRGKSSG